MALCLHIGMGWQPNVAFSAGWDGLKKEKGARLLLSTLQEHGNHCMACISHQLVGKVLHYCCFSALAASLLTSLPGLPMPHITCSMYALCMLLLHWLLHAAAGTGSVSHLKCSSL